jgi:hypothetical protein
MRKNEKMENKNIYNLYETSSNEEEDISDNTPESISEDEWLITYNEKIKEEKATNDKSNKNKEVKNNNYVNNKKNMSYDKFKEKFIASLKDLEKDSKNDDLLLFMNLDEDYLYSLYMNVYQNNPDQNFIFKNPLLILNYIYLEINKPDPSIPIIGANKETMKSVMTNVKEENSMSFNSTDSKKTKKNEEQDKKSEDKKIDNVVEKKNKHNSSSSSSSSDSSSSSYRNEDSSELEGKSEEEKTSKKVKVTFINNNSEESKENKDNNINKNINNILDNINSAQEKKDNKNENKNFIIVHQESLYFIQIRKIPTIKSSIRKDKEKKSIRKPRRKTQVLRQKSEKYYMLKHFKKTNSASFIKGDAQEKKYAEEPEQSSLNVSKKFDEEEEKDKSFSLFRQKNKKNIRGNSKGIFKDRKSKNENIINRKITNIKNIINFTLTKRDMTFGHSKTIKTFKKKNKKPIVEKKFGSKSSKNNIFTCYLTKEFNEKNIISKQKTSYNKTIKNNENKYKILKNKSFYEEKLKQFTQNKNNSLLRNFIDNSVQEKNNNKNNININAYNIFPQSLNNVDNNLQNIVKKISPINKKKNNSKKYGFKSKNEIQKKIEIEERKYLKHALNKNSFNNNKIINSNRISPNKNKSLLSKYNENKNKIKNEKKSNICNNSKKENEILYSYIDSMNNITSKKEIKEYTPKPIKTERDNKSKISRLNKILINEIIRCNDMEKKSSQKKKYNNDNTNMSYISKLNYNKCKCDDSMNNNNIIFENSSCINSFFNNSKFISLNNSKSFMCKRISNRSQEISDNNTDTKRFIKNIKLYPSFKISSKDNSGNASLSNTNQFTPRSKRQIFQKKMNNSLNYLSSIKKDKGRSIKKQK